MTDVVLVAYGLTHYVFLGCIFFSCFSTKLTCWCFLAGCYLGPSGAASGCDVASTSLHARRCAVLVTSVIAHHQIYTSKFRCVHLTPC